VVSTRCKLLVDEADDLAQAMGDIIDPTESQALVDKIKDAEQEIRRAQQLYPEDADIHQTEWRLGILLEQGDRALRALERAWKAQPRGPGVGIQLAKAYAARGDVDRAKDVLQTTLERSSDDKATHFELAKLLLRSEKDVPPRVGEHLARSYAVGDRNFEARHLYAQYLFMVGQGKSAQDLFDELDRRAPPEFRSSFNVAESAVSRRLPAYVGWVSKRDETYIFIRSSVYPKDIYANESHSAEAEWQAVRQGAEVTFRTRFKRNGPVAFDVRLAPSG
jgi:tetratricopeptide (TPR) repeat protein